MKGEGRSLEGDPIVLTKINPDQIEVPRDDYKVRPTIEDGKMVIHPNCLRQVEYGGKLWGVMYWNCPRELNFDDDDPKWKVIYKCSECNMVT